MSPASCAMNWAPLAKAQGGKLVVAAPARDALYYIGDDSRQAVAALKALSRKVRERPPAALSDQLLRWTPTGWERID
jgi:hypothetical protein